MPPSPRRKKRSPPKPKSPAKPVGERLQKVLSAAGIGSRRECETIIQTGRVEVDREFVTELGTRVDPEQQEIRVDGAVIKLSKRLYFALHKPQGVVSTSRDPLGRARVTDLVPNNQRVYCVGRLDQSSEGLMLLTNDGQLAHRLTHPRFGVEKTYLARVAGRPEIAELAQLRKGIVLAEGIAKVASIRIKRRYSSSTDLEIVLNEGKNREIRRVLARVGYKVLRLRRIAIGSLRLGDMPTAAYRPLTRAEIKQLQQCVTHEDRRVPQRKQSSGATPLYKLGSPQAAKQRSTSKKSKATRRTKANSKARRPTQRGSGRP